MHFSLLDTVLESPTAESARIVTLKNVTSAEEYLRDHFPSFPVLPGVLMIETLVQAARRLLEMRGVPGAGRMVLGSARAIKYGRFVRPGEGLRAEVEWLRPGSSTAPLAPDGLYEFRGEGIVVGGDGNGTGERQTAVAGKFTLRAVRMERRMAGRTEERVGDRMGTGG
jgi:3-hydroxymyristoyl/3-hydroxydecanoyl-(acyl carrier protein) dehydratase